MKNKYYAPEVEVVNFIDFIATDDYGDSTEVNESWGASGGTVQMPDDPYGVEVDTLP